MSKHEMLHQLYRTAIDPSLALENRWEALHCMITYRDAVHVIGVDHILQRTKERRKQRKEQRVR